MKLYNVRKTVLATTLGTVIEWAEFVFFAYMADQLSNHFFDMSDPQLARLKTYAIFATSYFMRPLGALLFGSIGDNYGRKPAMVGAILLMAVATTTIGLLPTYHSIGILAPLLLMVCRMLQGLAVAGEFNGSAVLLVEQAGNKNPYRAGSWTPFAAALGMLVGSFAATLSNAPWAPEWAWRVPFMASAAACLIAFYLRNRARETLQLLPSGTSRPRAHRLSTLLIALQENRQAFVTTMAAAMFISVFVYLGNLYCKTLAVNLGGFDLHLASKLATFGQGLAVLLIFYFGQKVDKIGGKKLLTLGVLAAFCFGPMIVWCAQTGDLMFALMGQAIYGIINGMVSAPVMTFLTQQFPMNARYTGTSFAWSISAAIFGGTALMVAEGLVQAGWVFGPGMYISFASAVFLATLLPYRKGWQRDRSLQGTS